MSFYLGGHVEFEKPTEIERKRCVVLNRTLKLWGERKEKPKQPVGQIVFKVCLACCNIGALGVGSPSPTIIAVSLVPGLSFAREASVIIH